MAEMPPLCCCEAARSRWQHGNRLERVTLDNRPQSRAGALRSGGSGGADPDGRTADRAGHVCPGSALGNLLGDTFCITGDTLESVAGFPDSAAFAASVTFSFTLVISNPISRRPDRALARQNVAAYCSLRRWIDAVPSGTGSIGPSIRVTSPTSIVSSRDHYFYRHGFDRLMPLRLVITLTHCFSSQ